MPALTAVQLERLFPFYVCFDGELRLVAVGRSLKKLIAEADRDRSLLELFDIERPMLPTSTFAAIQQCSGMIFVLTLRGRGLRLRGEVLPTDEGGLFVGTPWVQDVAALQSAGLTLRDFAAHDQTSDLLVMLRSTQTSVREAAQATLLLQQEAAKREAVVRDLEAKLQVIEQQRQTLRALSAPVIQLWEQVLAVPIIGAVDAERSAHLMHQLLEAVTQQRARYAILDVTGVSTIDEQVAKHFISLLRAVQLIGAQGLISGVGAALARSLTQLQIDLVNIRSFGSLRDALAFCLAESSSLRLSGHS